MLLNLDICADILSEKKFEEFVLLILKLPLCTWLPLHKALQLKKHNYDESPIFVMRTRNFYDEEGYSLILFCEEESMKMVTGNYNSARLFSSFEG